MASITNNFRTSLHGFNREDVVSFIENATLENEKEKRLLQDANARLQAELDEAANALDEAKSAVEALDTVNAERDSLVETNRRLSEELEQLRMELEDARNAPAAPHVPEAAASTPLSAPIPPISEIRPVQPTVSSQNYSELELAAYRRAEVTERLARERAGKIYEQVSSVFAGACGRLQNNESDLDSLSKTLQININQLQQILYSIRCAYSETEDSLKAVGEKNREFAESEL